LQCMAVISDMNQPLGNKVGNTLEIEETLDALKSQGPADLMELVNTLGAQMLVLGHPGAGLSNGPKTLGNGPDQWPGPGQVLGDD
ncbi:MAG: hypothetical protein ACFNOE_07805, partial [Limosilactobacillus fermentum]